MTLAEGNTALTAPYPLSTKAAKFAMLVEARPTSQSMPSFVSLPTWTHSGVTPAAERPLKTSFVWRETAWVSWARVYPAHAAGTVCCPGSAHESL